MEEKIPIPLKTEFELITQLSKLKQGPEDNGLDSEGIKVVLYTHNASHPNKNPIILVDSDNAVNMVNQILQEHNDSKDNRYQLIVKTGNHYTVVDLKIEKGEAKILILDAANDSRFYRLADNISEIDGVKQVYYAQGDTNKDNIQKDMISCPIFALAHAMALQKFEQIYEHLEKVNKKVYKQAMEGMEKQLGVSWNYMPPEININCQSSTVWDKYKKVYQETFSPKKNFFDKYDQYRIEMYKKSVDLDPSKKGNQGNIMPAVFIEVTKDALDFVNKAPEPKLKGIICEGTSSATAANKLLDTIHDIITSTEWEKLTRSSKKPKTIRLIEKYLQDDTMNVYEKLVEIQSVSKEAHASSGFGFFVSSVVKGKENISNELYGILKHVAALDDQSINNALDQLNNTQQLSASLK